MAHTGRRMNWGKIRHYCSQDIEVLISEELVHLGFGQGASPVRRQLADKVADTRGMTFVI